MSAVTTVKFPFSTITYVEEVMEEKLKYSKTPFEGGRRFYLKRITEAFPQPRAIVTAMSDGTWLLHIPSHDWDVVKSELEGITAVI